MALSNMQVFVNNARTLVVEKLGQAIDKFNAASLNAIQLSGDGFSGDFFEKSFYNSLVGAQRRVDRYAAQAGVTATELSQGKSVEVKVAGGFGPIIFEPAQLAWIEANEAEAMVVISGSMVEAIMQDMLNSSISSLVAAISNNSDATNDISATAGITQAALNDTDAMFGDASPRLRVRIMRGATAHKLIGQALANAERLFVAEGVQVIDILGKPVVITDAPALRVAGSPNKEIVLTLQTGAIIIGNTNNLVMNTETSNGKTRIETTYQADYDFTIEMLGYSWDTVNGGKSPTDADLATGTNWDTHVTDVKNTAGVVLIGDEAQ